MRRIERRVKTLGSSHGGKEGGDEVHWECSNDDEGDLTKTQRGERCVNLISRLLHVWWNPTTVEGHKILRGQGREFLIRVATEPKEKGDLV